MDSAAKPKRTCQEKYHEFLKLVNRKISLVRFPFLCACIGELLGTTILIIFGLGVGAQKTLGALDHKDLGDYLSVSINWGIAVTMGLFISGVMGAGLMNPALTLAFSLIGKVPFIRILPYTLCQIVGAWLGTLVLLAVYNERISTLTQGNRTMDNTGVIFVTQPLTSHGYCVLDQITSTALLAGLALAIGDRNNFNIPGQLQPFYIGLLITGLLGSMGLNCGAAMNPARDLGPRIALAMCGWGANAFQDSDYYFWIPIVGPYAGAIVGAILYQLLMGVHLPGAYEDNEQNDSKDLDDDDDDDDDDETMMEDEYDDQYGGEYDDEYECKCDSPVGK